MRLYVEVAKHGFRRYATYRGATLAGLFTNTIFGFIQAYVMVAIFEHRSDVGGFDLTDGITYVFVTQGFLAVVGAFGGGGEIGTRVRSGEIVTDMYRPADFQAYWLALDLGRAVFLALGRGVPPFLVGALVFDIRLPASPMVAIAFLGALVLATLTSFAMRFLVGLAAFWLLDDRGPAQLLSVVQLFFSGFIIPINFFPSALEDFARLLPFQAILQLPVEVYLGTTAPATALAIQLGWAIALLGCGRLLLTAATRKVVIQGG